MRHAGLLHWATVALITITLLPGSVAFAQTTSGTGQGLPMSPGDIIRAVERHNGNLDWLWKMLAIKPKRTIQGKLVEGAEHVWDSDCSKYSCRAEPISSEDLLDDAGRDLTVRVCVSGSACRILLFHESNKGWGLVDYLDSIESVHALPPEVRIVASSDMRWMVLGTLGGIGTGVSLYYEQWYEIRDGKLTKILSVPAHGSELNGEATRKFSTRFLRFRRDEQAELLEFAIQVRWKTRLHDQLLWQEERLSVYRREPGQDKFQFAPQQSEMTKESLEELTAFDYFDIDAFLRLHEDRLLRIAATGPDWQKAWLKTLVGDAAASPTKSSLLKALGPRN